MHRSDPFVVGIAVRIGFASRTRRAVAYTDHSRSTRDAMDAVTA